MHFLKISDVLSTKLCMYFTLYFTQKTMKMGIPPKKKLTGA